ncbi:protein DpdJ [Rhizobium leguminosarum]|uniref:protein DpdJ n=1 Tax=Rhizobium leguminosarum TaxID=384 RepID=UPI001CDB7801|nr:protein DpdJ [Rhizobium leguminosarum]MCA2411257.1 DEAD/DEAH box helicase [Rhizobium leguminosarum]
MALSQHALKVLDLIEAIEMRSLEWGFTDGSLSEGEALVLARSVVGAGGSSAADDIVEELIDAKVIFELHGSGSGVRLRSRFGELVRLLAANRQLFPNKPWQGAPHLVADFRVDRRPRRFPKRDRLPHDVLREHESVFASSPLRRDLWQSLTAVPGMKLAAFQERAAVRLSAPTEDGGTIVTAGTGSGKTIAFYLPAMIRIGETIGSDHWVKAVAIYPRTELLKDQFVEAFRMARTIDGTLAAHGRRQLKIGALFGSTPSRATEQELVRKEWGRRGQDFVCPFMRCPTCANELVWRQADIDVKTERLRCVRPECTGIVSDSEIVLTRERMQRQPPDILFTTTEMLNQRLSDHWMRGLFGVGAPLAKRPFLGLLDEVHTYEGVSGAQAALTLRRWRYLLASPISWAGLSATLGDAARFFADLTGAHPDRVVEITPTSSEYEEQGAEYQILLRGDPTSRASLLSTTIQTSILVPRLLDPPGANNVSGAFGRRAFLFTDDLDVTNRLYDDLRDAEAYTIFGKPDNQRRPLAAIRAGGGDAALRDVEGQRWRVCEDIGHPLDRRLIVGRTTSQDAGVNQSANIVVATTALEVGFNDPTVGAVIQHKAPRGMASFLQRKGRAGRDRSMRPITLTVLSDYGRDRAFYQAYEHLFDPALEPQNLPIRNPYVLKIQAVYALFDWLSARTAGFEKAWQWDLLSRPQTNPSQSVHAVLEQTKTTLSELIQGNQTTVDDLRRYLVSALAVDHATADTLLWEAPRSLLLEAVPTLVRRLFRQWNLAFPAPEGELDLKIDFHPLPDFVPRSLFSDLSLPEVRVILPPATANHDERVEMMPILQGLNQLVPGRVTRRFAHERGALSHWVSVNPAFPEQDRRISDYAEEHEFVGLFTGRFNDHVSDTPLLVFRPWTVRLSKAARSDALPSSNARLAWQTDIVSNGDPLNVPIPPRSNWRRLVGSIDFYLHRFRSSVSVRRFAPTAYANVRTLQDDFPVTVHFKSDDDRPAALGFELEVDGLRVDLTLPADLAHAANTLPGSLLATSKLSFARDTFKRDDELPSDLNPFQRDWLFQIMVSALLADAATTGRSITEVAGELLSEQRLEGVFHDTMSELFGALPPTVPDDEDDDSDDELDDDTGDAANGGRGTQALVPRGPGRLQQALSIQLRLPIVRERLRLVAQQLSQPDPAAFDRWLRALVLETLGEAMLQACIAAAPRQATVDTLLVDVRDDSESGETSVWITETTLGGAGVLQAFAERFASEPQIFLTALEAALAATDLELVDDGLRQILHLALNDADVAGDMMRLRGTNSHSERATVWRSLSHRLTQNGGVDVSHAFSVSLNIRLLRAGSGPQLDQLLLDLQAHWDRLEEQFSISIGLREFAYICSRDAGLSASIRSFLSATLPAAAIGNVTVLAAVTSLLWPRADEVRQRTLQSYNPYRQARSTDPAVVRHLLLTRSTPTVELADPDWFEQLSDAFDSHGVCQLATSANNTGSLRQAIVFLVATPINIGVLQFFPVVERVDRASGRILATLTLREQI